MMSFPQYTSALNSRSRHHLGFHSSSFLPSLGEPSWTLTSFLAHAQFNCVDFLPITWHAAMDQVGIGGTASLRQRMVNLSLSFVFKCIHPRHFPYLPEQAAESLAFKLLVKEMYIASHQDLRHCDNIVCLEGISWDVEDNGKVWPVLVYEKAKYGSIKTFIEKFEGDSRRAGSQLPFEKRLDVCAQIANGLRCMHKAGIVHSDVKPDNILVFENTQQGFTAKLTDFGYSNVCISVSQDEVHLKTVGSLEDRINLTKASIWSHPSRRDYSYGFKEAVLEEVYTFGMTCLWILFSQSTAFPGLEKLRKMKVEGQMPGFCAQLAQNSDIEMTVNQTEFLQKLFQATLSHDEKERATFPEIVNLFDTGIMSTEGNFCQTFDIVIPPGVVSHPEFRLVESFLQLCAVDYRVRAFIRKCISKVVEEVEQGTEKYRRTHLQMAYCYALGFGGEVSKEKRDMHLQEATASLVEIEEQTHELRQIKGVHYYSGKFRDAMESGLVPPLDLGQAIRDVPSSANLVELEKEEIKSLEKILGPTNTTVVHMKVTFATMLGEHGQSAPAHEMLFKCLEALERSGKGSDAQDRLFIKAQLADAKLQMGKWKEAETLIRDVLKEHVVLNGELHAETLTLKNQLALMLADQGRWDEAIPIQEDILKYQEKRLGKEHPLTLQFVSSLVQSLIELGDYHKAEHWMDEIVTLRDSVWGNESPDTLLSLMDEARLADARGRPEAAKNLERDALKRCKRSLEQDHLFTLDCMMNLAQSLTHRSEQREAEQLAKDCVTAYTRVRGPNHPDTLRSRTSLSSVYQERGNYREAERLDSCSFRILMDTLGPVHPFTLTSMHSLGHDYWKLNKLVEAEKLLAQAVQGRTERLGKDHRETLDSQMILANIYADQNELIQAKITMESAFEGSTRTLGNQHPDTLTKAINLTTIYADCCLINEAMRLEEVTLNICRSCLAPDDDILLCLVSNLAMSYIHPEVQRYEEALALAEEAVKGSLDFDDGGDSEHLGNFQNTLAHVYSALGRLEDAKTMHEHALECRRRIFGEGHEDTLASEESIRKVEEKISRRTEELNIES